MFSRGENLVFHRDFLSDSDLRLQSYACFKPCAAFMHNYLARSANLPTGLYADRAIYFTFRNLARSANLPEGLSILLALISFFF